MARLRAQPGRWDGLSRSRENVMRHFFDREEWLWRISARPDSVSKKQSSLNASIARVNCCYPRSACWISAAAGGGLALHLAQHYGVEGHQADASFAAVAYVDATGAGAPLIPTGALPA